MQRMTEKGTDPVYVFPLGFLYKLHSCELAKANTTDTTEKKKKKP